MSYRKENQTLKQLQAAAEHIQLARINVLTAKVQYDGDNGEIRDDMDDLEDQVEATFVNVTNIGTEVGNSVEKLKAEMEAKKSGAESTGKPADEPAKKTS